MVQGHQARDKLREKADYVGKCSPPDEFVSCCVGNLSMVRSRHPGGFSLLELLAVVVILGIIAAIVVPRVSNSSKTAKQNTKHHTISALNSSIEQFYTETGNWPTNLSELVPNYLPDGVPAPPDGSPAYTIDATLHRVLP